MTGRSNKGPFEPCFVPAFADDHAPHGIARLVASEHAHLTDFARLARATDNPEDNMPRQTKRDTFLKSAEMFVADCARAGVAWDDVWAQVEDGYKTAHVELTGNDEQQLLETWLATEPQERAA